MGKNKTKILFYSEDISSFVHFEQIIHELTEKMGRQICYVTSAKDDPILKNQNEKIRAFYIGNSEIAKLKFFLGIENLKKGRINKNKNKTILLIS